MSAYEIGWVYRHSPFIGATFAVHLALADSANDQHDRELWAADATIAAKARVSVPTVRRARTELEEAGFLALVTPGRGRGKTNLWQLLLPEDAPVIFRYRREKSDHHDHFSGNGKAITSARKAITSARKSDHHDRLTQVDIELTQGGEKTAPPSGAPSDQVQPLVAAYVDDFRVVCNGHDPSSRFKASAGRAVKQALADGEHPDVIGECLAAIARERKNPGSLPYVIADYHATQPNNPRRIP